MVSLAHPGQPRGARTERQYDCSILFNFVTDITKHAKTRQTPYGLLASRSRRKGARLGQQLLVHRLLSIAHGLLEAARKELASKIVADDGAFSASELGADLSKLWSLGRTVLFAANKLGHQVPDFVFSRSRGAS